MKCQRCKEREANVQIIQQTNGKKPQVIMLCDVCAKELGIFVQPSPFGYFPVFSLRSMMAFSRSSGSMFQESASESMNTGVAPR